MSVARAKDKIGLLARVKKLPRLPGNWKAELSIRSLNLTKHVLIEN